MKIKIKSLIIMVVLLLGFMPGIEVRAEGTITYGSESYTADYNGEFQIGVYIKADEEISSYEVYLEYNPQMLEFVEGADLVEDGRLKVTGTGRKDNYREMLTFRAKLQGDTELTIAETTLYGKEDEDGETPEIEVAEVSAAPITVETNDGCELESLTVSPVELTEFDPTQGEYFLTVGADVEELSVTAVPEDSEAEAEVSDTSLEVGDNLITVEVTRGNRSMQYLLHVYREEPEEVITEPTEDVTEEPATEAPVEKDSHGIDWDKLIPSNWVLLLIAGIAAVVLLICILLLLWHKEKRRRRRRMRQRQRRIREMHEKAEHEQGEEPVISMRHICMEFKLAQDESSSLKEFLIRTVKGKNTYRTLKALDDISMDIYKGEVIGIIGTNGSGKSTLLKIVSGALQPSSGRIMTDFGKVQLLTLGTGFDMELTARENVYLNGAIIGYTREYIDEKFDDIVEFAELEGFMDERVKNFSSGMVSRLGFAIATMRDTPEILILDEVLSVGDMFFRKKSEKRIKEMINSGSTVLIVSHSTATIKANCTKAVWIEKGVLRAMGDPDEVCRAYESMEQQN